MGLFNNLKKNLLCAPVEGNEVIVIELVVVVVVVVVGLVVVAAGVIVAY